MPEADDINPGDLRPGHIDLEKMHKLNETGRKLRIEELRQQDETMRQAVEDAPDVTHDKMRQIYIERCRDTVQREEKDAPTNSYWTTARLQERLRIRLARCEEGSVSSKERKRHVVDYCNKTKLPRNQSGCDRFNDDGGELRETKVDAEVKQHQDLINGQEKSLENAQAIGKAQHDAEKKANDEVACAWVGLHCSK